MIRRRLDHGQGRADMIVVPELPMELLPQRGGRCLGCQPSSNGSNGHPDHFLTRIHIDPSTWPYIQIVIVAQKIKQLEKPRYLRYFSYFRRVLAFFRPGLAA